MLPAHIAIIMDGNGRWAKERGLPRAAGHRRLPGRGDAALAQIDLTAGLLRQVSQTLSEVVETHQLQIRVREVGQGLLQLDFTIADVLYQLVGGLRSGMTYVGASSLQDLWERAQFVRITGAGFKESGSHDVQRI